MILEQKTTKKCKKYAKKSKNVKKVQKKMEILNKIYFLKPTLFDEKQNNI